MEFYSCKAIESELVLDLFDLKFCCIPHSNGTKGFVPVCKYDGAPLPLERIREAREALTELNNRDGIDSPCKGCHYLVKKEWKPQGEAPRFDLVQVSSFSACNLKCVYCYVYTHEDWLPKVAYSVLPVFQEMTEKGYLIKGASVNWGGGEPTILKDFEEASRLLLRCGIRQKVFTNAVRHSPVIEAGRR